MDHDEARTRILDAAEKLFYERGIQSVGMDELRSAAGVSLKRLYQCFPAKQHLVEAYLRRRDARWRAELSAYVTAYVTECGGAPAARPLAVFDWLRSWFLEPGFRGCAFINAYGEMGATADGVARAAREHKAALLAYMTGLVRDALPAAEPAGPAELVESVEPAEPAELAALAGQLALLVDGAITAAAITGDPDAARQALTAAESLLSAASTGLRGRP
ncbi:TetR/AcrR family transcriptional regulator [Streptomyces sp. NPDC001339]|uniref:TetR/AcrR family transcriptional regulator n=1 Tax=Streptomyces sp. NPDC001339 TaxID=3364563 RepID=UPI0036A92553